MNGLDIERALTVECPFCGVAAQEPCLVDRPSLAHTSRLRQARGATEERTRDHAEAKLVDGLRELGHPDVYTARRNRDCTRRANELIANGSVRELEGARTFFVAGDNGENPYLVTVHADGVTCSCRAGRHMIRCYHREAVETIA